jgi:hypothetical protein
MSKPTPRTLYEKLFDEHVAVRKDNGAVLLYIGEEQPPVLLIRIAYLEIADRHLIHEVSSPVRRDSILG